ncbi:recombinase family protein [Rossellomorea marisflavi]|uniref:recombinase family protein n=1 Tax=Rossellomorea marisflavi TaxID=189381 RepID=UPI003D2F43D8
MKAALYIRVSTQDQIENYSIESQRERLEAFVKSKGWSTYDIYVDGGYSGSNINRPALQKLLQDLHKIDVVIVYKLDRLSRSQRDTLSLIEEHFLINKVDFVSITETLDTSTPFGKAMIGILSVFAQLERETISERMKMGLIKRAEAGYRAAGGNFDPAGYGRKEDSDLYLKENEAAHVKATFDLYEQFHSITKVQARLKDLGYPVWRFRRYRDILSAKLYCGYVSFAGDYYKGRHEPIVSEEQFNRVQELLSRHKGQNAHKAKASLLSGLIKCGHCGENYVTYQSKDKVVKDKYYRYYMCRARRFPSEYEEKCMNKTWNYNKIEQLIVDEIEGLTTKKKLSNKGEEPINYNSVIKKIDEKIERLLSLYIDPDSNFSKKMLDKQMVRLDEEKRRVYDLKLQQEHRLQNSFSIKELEQYKIDLTTADFSTKQAIVQKLIQQITIYGEDIELTWNF